MLIDILSDRHPDLAAVANAEGSLRFTVNRRYVERDHPIQPADTVGLFPPVTGGYASSPQMGHLVPRGSSIFSSSQAKPSSIHTMPHSSGPISTISFLTPIS